MPRSAAAVTASLSRVPPFPPVAAKLLSLLCGSSVDLGEVADLISGDATFTARLLQRVNSAEFGLLTDVRSVKQAVALLGIDLTRNIIVAQATEAYTAGALGVEELRRCWQHTLATAVLADEIAKACGHFTQAAFTAGIVHDIGRLGLLVAYPQDYERIIRDAAERCLDLLDFEHEEFGLDHAAAGRILAERWELPAEMASIAGRHHDPTEGAELTLLRIVHVACRLADALGFEVVKPLTDLTPEQVLAELPENARKNLNADPVEFHLRIERLIAKYGSSSQSAPPPEETLALLSPPAAANAEPEPPAEAQVSPESPRPKEGVTKLAWAIAGVLIVAAGLITALVLWQIR
ncbi:MAG TPA: HDOD domain-containing protein [Bryobacteraceae bacterium]|nr:HDOD domain-containing protein [Bryobacteraceae bacterium]